MSDADEKLNDVRKQIDDIDQTIQNLVVQRAEIVKEVSRIKQQDNNAVFYRPEREALVLKKIMSRNCGALPPKEMAKIFREIMSTCLAFQKPMQVAFLGPEGTFSQVATIKHFGSAVCEVPCETIPGIFEKVTNGEAAYGVVPIENTIGGLVEVTLNEFIESELNICGEVSIDIKQTLLQKNTDEPIHKIYSHQQSLLQCHNWLTEHYPEAELVAVPSNALAARHAANEKNTAAVAGMQCAEFYNLEVIKECIENHKNNKTRFLIIGHNKPDASGDDRTTLLIKVYDAPGALEKLINPFAKNNINLTMIRSKPANYSHDAYYFFLDLDCYYANKDFINAVKELEAGPMNVKILGSYPKAVI